MARQLSLSGFEPPNTALYVSALVKSIRLRRTEDAITWLLTVWRFPSLRYRLTRRVLVSSGEDGLSPELIEAVALWYSGPNRYSLGHAAQEVGRICGTPSWWALPDGHEMIFAWKRAEAIAAQARPATFDVTLSLLEQAVAEQRLISGLGAFTRASVLPEFSNARLVSTFGSLVEQSDNERATRLFDSWRQIAAELGRDTNICGLLAFLLLGGRVPVVAVPAIGSTANVRLPVQLTANRAETAGQTIPPVWANDGIHARTEGPMDRRFAGVLSNFVAMCRAFDFYGRLDPNDPWLPEFYSCD